PEDTKWTRAAFKKAITADKYRVELYRDTGYSSNRAITSSPNPIQITFYNSTFQGRASRREASSTVVHELAHAWDNAHGDEISNNMAAATGGSMDCSWICRRYLPLIIGA